MSCRGIAETGLILSGLNFNGYTDSGKARWDRYINTHIRKVELCPSAAQLPQHWNICTGLFLRQCEWGSYGWLGMLPEGCRAQHSGGFCGITQAAERLPNSPSFSALKHAMRTRVFLQRCQC